MLMTIPRAALIFGLTVIMVLNFRIYRDAKVDCRRPSEPILEHENRLEDDR